MASDTTEIRHVGPYPAPNPAGSEAVPHVVTLSDGTRLVLRVADTRDDEQVRSLIGGLLRESQTVRCFVAPADSDSMLQPYIQTTTTHTKTVVATLASSPEHGKASIAQDDPHVGLARFAQIAPETAEVALVVAESYRRRGIGTVLMHSLAEHAAAHGISTFVANVRSANTRVLTMIRRAGIPVRWAGAAGDLHLLLDVKAMAHRGG